MENTARDSRPIHPIRVAVADRQAIDCHALMALLRGEPDFVIVGGAGSPQAAVDCCRDLCPAVLLLDSRMPDLDGVPAITAVHTAAPATRVLAIAHSAEGRCPVMHALPGDVLPEVLPGLPCELGPDCLQLAVMRGAAGAIRRTASPEELFDAIRVVAMGNSWFTEGTAEHLVGQALRIAAHTGSVDLTARDLEVAALIAGGRCNKEIAERLGVGEPTVKKHVGRLLRHFGLQDRLQLGLFLLRHPQLLAR